MKNVPLGCFTTSGIMAAVLTALIITGFAFASGGMLFSPGPLNARTGDPLGNVNSHADIAGKCNLCHAPFWSTTTMADRCAACHTDVASQWQDPSTLHGTLRKNNPTIACRNCHPDHRGATAPLTDMASVKFPHEPTGYSLKAHQSKGDRPAYGCTDCHGNSYVPPFEQAVCVTCHQEIDSVFTQTHTAAFGTDCIACHDGIDTYGGNFNHNNQNFPLKGRHAKLLCTGCHPHALNMIDLKSTPQDCYSCHAKDDNHQGRFGNDCGSCHNPIGWTPALFDHNLSTFPLTGSHITVSCDSCHINNVFLSTPSDCYSCHAKSDKHKGQYGTNCAACHTPDGWLPASVKHDLFAFKLTGKHITVSCESCHINNVFKGTPGDCYSCHRINDAHKGRFGTNCGACHTTDGWLPATFDHGLSRFPLTGAHASLACNQCHANGVYAGLSTACVACHADPAFHAGLFGTNCVQCHNTSTWAGATFNHPGGCGGPCLNHEGATCADCHPAGPSNATCTKCHGGNNPGGGD